VTAGRERAAIGYNPRVSPGRERGVSQESSDRPGDLQFDKAESVEGAAPPAADCGLCGQPLGGSYYQLNAQPVCERCKMQVEYDRMSSSGSGRFLRAGVFGLGAALAGGALWYAVRATTGYEIGLIAVVVGLMVGAAVRAGARGRGGRLYQVLAVGLTYFGICVNYVPDIVKAIRDQPAAEVQQAVATAPAGPAAATPAAVPPAAVPATEASVAAPVPMQMLMAFGLILAFALAAPFLGGFENIIGILIIGFALWEAWKLNRPVALQIEGPFRLGTPPPGAEPR
jgi:hypothetical protein